MLDPGGANFVMFSREQRLQKHPKSQKGTLKLKKYKFQNGGGGRGIRTPFDPLYGRHVRKVAFSFNKLCVLDCVSFKEILATINLY